MMMSNKDSKRRTAYLNRRRKNADTLHGLCSKATQALQTGLNHFGNPERDEILGVTKNWLEESAQLYEELTDAQQRIAEYLGEDMRAIVPTRHGVYLNRKNVGKRLFINLHNEEMDEEDDE